jgi:electron transfer flavoprotein alpha subunit
MAVLLYADHNNRTLNPAVARTLTAALAVSSDVDVLVAGQGSGAVAEAAARLGGVRKVLLAEAPHLERHLAEELSALVTPLMAGYDALIVPSTTTGKNFAPRVAALLDTAQISDISAVKSPTVFERPIYAGNAIQTVEAGGAKMVITVRATSFAAAPEGGPAPIETLAPPGPVGLSAFIREELTQSDRPELTSARVVISGGRGMQSAENFKLLDGIAGKLNAAVGASRAAVDSGFASNDCQVGQTGKVVAPELYIAVGISGAIQHLAGMKDSKVIVAINKDEEAPIFQVADYGLVADLFQALPEFESELDKVGR